MTSLIIDKITGEKTRKNKELIAQGIGSWAVAVIGGIPGAQATIRSVLIIKEKATSRFAGVLVGVLIFIELLLFQNYINLIPKAVLCAVIIKVGFDIFDFLPIKLYLKEWFRKRSIMSHKYFSSHLKEKLFVTHIEVMIITGTALMTVFWGLNYAVGIFTVFFYLWNKVLRRKHPMRDLRPYLETQGQTKEI